MVRTQVQLPDRLYRQLKQAAESDETSLAEVIRRAGEYYLAVHPQRELGDREWAPPPAVDLGEILADPEDWRMIANERSGP